MTDKRYTERLDVLIQPDQLAALDDYCAAFRPPIGRSEAVRRLIDYGLERLVHQPAEPQTGIPEAAAAALSGAAPKIPF